MLDVAIRGGEVVDGTGASRRRGDVGIVEGRVVAVGEVGQARRTIEADGLIVAPGFCDIHTHFDAQVFWDPALTPSSLHGVTSVIAGNCGLTLAPVNDHDADYLLRMVAVVEGMPVDALRASVPFDWTTTGEYLDHLEGHLAINAGFMVGHSALRRAVMGPAATQREATPDEVAAMVALLRDGLDAGSVGFSSSWGVTHKDADGAPVPSRHAHKPELLALAGACGTVEGTSLEFARSGQFDDDDRELLVRMSAAAARPLNWNVMRATKESEAECQIQLELGTYSRDHGADVVALVMPVPRRAWYSFGTGFLLDLLPGWRDVMALPPEQRLAALGDPEVRRRLETGAQSAGRFRGEAEWGARVITQTFSPSTEQYNGRLVADIAREVGKDPLDALLDIACADGLATTFSRVPWFPSADDWRVGVRVWRDKGAVIGGSDAGAHLDFTGYFDYPMFVLEHGVREFGVLSLEEAIHLMTDVPATLYGLRDRGRLAEGEWADIVVFDESTVACGELAMRFDMPTGAGRLWGKPAGVHQVLVNGEVVVCEGSITDARPGRVLRSGRDTRTPNPR